MPDYIFTINGEQYSAYYKDNDKYDIYCAKKIDEFSTKSKLVGLSVHASLVKALISFSKTEN